MGCVDSHFELTQLPPDAQWPETPCQRKKRWHIAKALGYHDEALCQAGIYKGEIVNVPKAPSAAPACGRPRRPSGRAFELQHQQSADAGRAGKKPPGAKSSTNTSAAPT